MIWRGVTLEEVSPWEPWDQTLVNSCPSFHSFIHSHVRSTYNALGAALGAEMLAEKTETDLAFLGCTVQCKRQALNR